MAALKPKRPLAQFVCLSCQRMAPQALRRAFTTTTVRRAEDDPFANILGDRAKQNRQSPARPGRFSPVPSPPPRPGSGSSGPFSGMLESQGDDDIDSILSGSYGRSLTPGAEEDVKPHRLHVYATKHNTHLTLVQPPKPAAEMAGARSGGNKLKNITEQNKMVDMVMSLSAGNIGFRKAGRGSYDAAYQLAAFLLKQMNERGIIREVQKLEVVLRGFGAGREAVTKVLLGTEGRHIRHRISSVIDATRLKHGGSRSPKPRRLG